MLTGEGDGVFYVIGDIKGVRNFVCTGGIGDFGGFGVGGEIDTIVIWGLVLADVGFGV